MEEDSEVEFSEKKMTKGERTRERILACAIELFSQSGFSAVSLRDIAARAHMTHAGLLHHFASKDDLLLAALSRRDEVQGSQILEGHGPQNLTECRAFFSSVIATVERNSSERELVSLYVKLSAEASDVDHPAHSYFRRRYSKLRRSFEQGFSVWLAATGGDVSTARVSGERLIAVMDGLQLQWILEEGTEAMAVDMVAAVREFFAGYGFVPTDEEITRALSRNS